MKGFQRLVTVINWMLAVAVAIAAMAWAFMPGDFVADPNGVVVAQAKLDALKFTNDMSGQITFVMGGALLILLNVILVVKLMRRASYQRSIRFQNPGGEVIVHLAAVEECLTRAVRESESVHDVKVRVFSSTKERPIRVKADVSLWDTPDIPSVIEKLQDRLRVRFVEILNTEEPVNVVVTVKKLGAKRDSKRKSSEAGGASAETGFKGPEYPID